MPADIIYIDDEPQPLLAVARAAHAGQRFAEFIPPDYAGADAAAAQANLWVFDFFNDDEERQNPGLAKVGSNGLSVFQQLRLMVGESRPPAMVVSNHLDAALGDDVNLARRHILAEEVGVEWVAPKVRAGSDAMSEILSIADAAATLRRASAELEAAEPSQYVAQLARRVLRLPGNAEWARSAIRDVASWRPPTLSAAKGDPRPEGLRQSLPVQSDTRLARNVIAWLIRQALPYPSFVVRDRHLAIRLGLTLASLRAAFEGDTPLAKRLRRGRYRGVLADLDGPRWWSAAVDSLAWELRRSPEKRTAALRVMLGGAEPEELGIADPVVVSDGELVETDEIAGAVDCVRAADEHFPSHAPPAWVKIEDAQVDKALARKVKLEDQPELAVQD
jgi:hypothetical protein